MPSNSRFKQGVVVVAVSSVLFFIVFKVLPLLWVVIYLCLTFGSIVLTGESIEHHRELKAAQLERKQLEKTGAGIYMMIRKAMPMEIEGFERMGPSESEFNGSDHCSATQEIKVCYHFRSKDGNDHLFAKLIVCPDSHLDSFLIPTAAVPLPQGPWTYGWWHEVYRWNDQLWPQDRRSNYGNAVMVDYYLGKWEVRPLSIESKELINNGRIADELSRWYKQWSDGGGEPVIASGGRVVWPTRPKREGDTQLLRQPYPKWGEPKLSDLPQEFQIPCAERCRPCSINPKCVYLRISGSSWTKTSLLIGKIDFEALKALTSPDD